jgi:predicted ATP-dependent protease
MATVKALDAQSLRQACDPSLFAFATTAELATTTEFVGQSRAVDAMQFGIEIQRPGYNLFVLGEPGSGRHAVVRRMLWARPMAAAPVSDWCYVNNFSDGNQPRLLRVPAGRGAQLSRDMQQFVAELSKAIEGAFEGDEYRARIEAIQADFKEKEEGALRALGQESSEKGIALLRTPLGFTFTPMKGEQAMEPEEFAKLPDEEKTRIGRLIEGYSERLRQLMVQLPPLRRQTQVRIRNANRETLRAAVGHLIEELKEHYRDLDGVLAFLDEVMDDVIEIGEQLRESAKGEGEMLSLPLGGNRSLARYQVNLLVDHAHTKAAPVVYEDNPTYPNLVGRVDHIAQLGTLVTNFTMIRPGALHRANGGYLVLDAVKVLLQPYAWEGLKRALHSREVRIESLGQVLGVGSTASLEPEAMPLTVKVVLVGERRLYYLLKTADPEFAELFKVAADMENDLERDASSMQLYAEFIATLAHGAGLRPFDRGAVARVVEHGARLSGSADKLSGSRRGIGDLLQEAEHRAAQAGRATVGRDDVEAALGAQVRRIDRLRGRVQEEILRDNLLISVTGVHPGQVNGLSVLVLDDFAFGHPVRITATVRIGDGNVIDIERETELGGAIHSKGVMILASFIGARYSREMPLSFSGSLVFEQTYGPVEGDSASLAELCALLSSIAMLPMQQSLGVTGSVNQFGRVQAIGAVNEKIEGFFDICQARGLTGEQGVIIPVANMKHLMLRDDVVKACAERKFAVYAVEDVDEAMELLTGLPAGVPDAEGRVPKGTVNFQVAAQLVQLTALRRAFAAAGREPGGRKRGGNQRPRKKKQKAK